MGRRHTSTLAVALQARGTCGGAVVASASTLLILAGGSCKSTDGRGEQAENGRCLHLDDVAYSESVLSRSIEKRSR